MTTYEGIWDATEFNQYSDGVQSSTKYMVKEDYIKAYIHYGTGIDEDNGMMTAGVGLA